MTDAPIDHDIRATPRDTTARRWKTMLLDGVGFMAVIWILPLAILMIGVPIVLAAKLVVLVAGWMLSAS
jgi:hypothetical protein